METFAILYTRGDATTQPGGIILRRRPDPSCPDGYEYIAHHFNRKPGSMEPIEFFWGRYHQTQAAGMKAFQEKLDRVKCMLIPATQAARIIKGEKK